jgi:carbamoyltransferase
MEFGPRALGNRSIIADPRNQQMQSVMNLKIKQRESFRPFAPAVLAEDVAKYFDINCLSPYMLLVADVQSDLRLAAGGKSLRGMAKLNELRSSLPAITHVDYSARVQTVHQTTNPEFYALLQAFKALSGESVLINTSFNVRGEPPVCSPQDAVRCFLATDMDYLVMNNFILEKSQQSAEHINQAKAVTFEKD